MTATPFQPTDAESGLAPVLTLTDVSFAYKTGQLTIGAMNLSVAPGEIVSLIGPSGCGKSTLLRLISGLALPTHGHIERRLASKERHGCSMVFQEDTVLPWLRVRDNVLLHDRFQGRHRSKRAKEEATKLLEMVGLEAAANQFPARLSGGMKRRVAMLTALAAKPELLLLDEPFSALDEPTRIGVHRDIYRLVREIGTSVVLVTHDLAEAISLSDRVLLLSTAPSSVVSQYVMPFGDERNMREIRTDSRFLQIYGQLWEELSAQTSNGGAL